jgi:hypothetical protein
MTEPVEQFVSSRDGEVRAVLAEIDTGFAVTAAHLSPLAAGTDQPVADPSQAVTADAEPLDAKPNRTNGDLVEHERQRRLARWQTLGPR